MKKLVTLCTVTLTAVLLIASVVGCQQQPSQELKFTKVTEPFSVDPEASYGFHIPQGSVIYHWANGITEVYGPDSTRILIARDSEATQIPAPGGPAPATYVYYGPNGTIDDWDESTNTMRIYLEDGALTLILTIIEKDENYERF